MILKKKNEVSMKNDIKKREWRVINVTKKRYERYRERDKEEKTGNVWTRVKVEEFKLGIKKGRRKEEEKKKKAL